MKYPLFIVLAVAWTSIVPLDAAAPAAVLPNVTVQASEIIPVWPGEAPGETAQLGPELVLPDRPRPFDQITNVSVPTLAVFRPAAEKRNGTGVLVIPGGGLERLAIEHEGYEVAEWLTARGITAFVLKYRVPFRNREQRWKAGLQDAQRAMGIIRARAADWQVDRDAIGSIGFSAGAEINVMLSVYHAEPRQYPPIDDADKLSTRPDFNLAIYGGGFASFASGTLREDIASRLGKTTPPMFVAHAFDDQAQNSIVLMAALKRANVASELHLFGAGGHGFGVRDTGLPVGQWRDLALNWIGWLGFLDPAPVRGFAQAFAAAVETDAVLPAFGAFVREGDLAQAYAAQRRVVRQAVERNGGVAGYKAAFTTKAGQAGAGVAQPAHGVLFRAGRIEAKGGAPVTVKASGPLLVETEIGYVIATDIGTKLRVPRQALTTVEGIVPVIELPRNPGVVKEGKLVINGLDAIAANVGSNRFIVGPVLAPNRIQDLDAVAVKLQRDGRVLHETTGADVDGGQAGNLMTLINQIIDQGHVLHRGDVIISGALGGAKPGEKGRYQAEFGPLGRIEFVIE